MVAIKGLKPVKFRRSQRFAKSACNGFCNGELCACVGNGGEDHAFRFSGQVREKDSSNRDTIVNFASIGFLIIRDGAFKALERAKFSTCQFGETDRWALCVHRWGALSCNSPCGRMANSAC